MDVKNAILDAAEKRMREGGFHACSFREIANDVGIRSASVHHHFRTKTDLAASLVARYETKVLKAIGDPEDERDLTSKLAAMRAAFRTGLKRGDGMCLGGVFATETSQPAVASRDCDAALFRRLQRLAGSRIRLRRCGGASSQGAAADRASAGSDAAGDGAERRRGVR